MKRTLVLNAERLAELSTDDLRGVHGGATPHCPTFGYECDRSLILYSHCYCETGYCTTDGR